MQATEIKPRISNINTWLFSKPNELTQEETPMFPSPGKNKLDAILSRAFIEPMAIGVALKSPSAIN